MRGQGWTVVVRCVLVVIHGLLAAGAVVSGQAMVREPGGSTLGFRVEWLNGSPFKDYRLPGAFLATAIAGTNAMSAAGLWRREKHAPLLSLGTGILLVAWLGIQTAIIGFRHWSQAIWWAMFPATVVFAAVLWDRSARAPG